ncbi:zinc finger protein 572-like [Zerene cesonia]|uniref:zinc finger protein 572-like n=1 Tax=Zerene cesonia TaxID=33412 RepID=UPI0018E560BC|nr:zinc finger protein 572-like [Zerene cesonia]
MFTCSFCDKTFKYGSEKKRHEKSHIPEFECPECLKKFSFVSALRRHQKQHERKERVNCPECGRSFRDDTLLKRHIKYAHKEVHICTKCQTKFNSLQALQSHEKTHRPKSERRYKCSYNGCMKTFNFAHHLRNHELTHSGEKQHHCNLCGKGFIQLHHLKTHLRSHQPNSWLKCIPDCGKVFTNEYALKRHIATHKHKEIDTQCNTITTNACLDLKQEIIEAERIQKSDINKVFTKEVEDWFDKYQFSEELNGKENNVIEQNNDVQHILLPSNNIDNDKIIFNVDKRTTKLFEKKNYESNCSSCACDKLIKSNQKNNMPALKYNSDGTIKIKEFIDEDILIENKRNDIVEEKEEHKSESSNHLIPYNSCKAILGKCIVSGSGTISEECLCAKMAIDDHNPMISQEIDELTPHPAKSMA